MDLTTPMTKNEVYNSLLEIYGTKYCQRHRLLDLLDRPSKNINRVNVILHELLTNGKEECMKFIINKSRDQLKLGKKLVWYVVEKNMLEVLKYIDELYPKIIYEALDSRGNSILHVACRNGYLDTVKYLVEEKRFDLEVKNYDQETPLKQACEIGRIDCVKYLISKGASVNSKDSINQTSLFYASCLEIANILLGEGAEADICNDRNETPLYWAAIESRLDVVDCLLERKVRVDVPDNKAARTPLSWACRLGFLDIVRRLVAAGADINHQDNNKHTPLTLAAYFGHLEIVKELLGNKSPKVRVDVADVDGKTALSWACEFGHLEIIRLLIYKHADVNHQDEDKRTPLILAAANGHAEVVKELLSIGLHKYNKSKKVRVDMSDDSGVTALMYACQRGYLDIVSTLISARADVNHQDNSGKTPLMLATSYDHLDVVDELLSVGVDKYQQSDKVQVDLPDKTGRTALSWACEFGFSHMISCLISSGANINHQDTDKKTPLIISVWDAHVDVIEELLSVGVDDHFESVRARLDVRDHSGRTALSWACQLGNLEIVSRLISEGVDVNRPDNKRRTPLMWAAASGNLKVIETLLSAGALKSVSCDADKYAYDYAATKYTDCARLLNVF
ncbi:transient receptor potential cation channel subfamily A member 1-like [Rhynchophorus ferrugineus]|uniref:transient receptor potential cation channel subfamily A member 1-like n=1 Tax=Rhynchophorus ferrugineus TaxID=354439 RepID=UPI003FCE7232